MVNLAASLFGPLAGPECRRALGRGWLILVRLLAGLALWGATLIVLWIWWMSQGTDPAFQPFAVVRTGLGIVEGMLVTIALVLGPAVLAGSIAGEKERGVMALLLSTGVSAREIVVGRLAGKLSQVAMIVLAGWPAVVALAALAGMSPGTFAVLLALPASVALGGGGLAVLASTVSRRGRDALLTVYLLDLLFLLSPLGARAGLSSRVVAWLGTLNPFAGLADLVWLERATPALVSIGLWLAIGLLATSVAARQLRTSSLRPLDGERAGRLAKRRGRVPPVDETRPMLWKELFVERMGALGGLGWWLGALMVVLLGGGSLVLGGMIAWSYVDGSDPAWARSLLSITIGESSFFVGWLIQWAVGLRAAVTIASERERGTWDALLTSPLEGPEIVRAKLWGSLHALRWLFLSALVSWTIAAVCDAISWKAYADAVIGTAILAAFMAAVGVRTSLSAATATRSMAITIGVWLLTRVLVTVAAAILFGVGLLLVSMTMWIASIGSTAWLAPTFRFVGYLWPLINYGLYVAITALLITDTRLRFDRIAGRMTAGRVANALDAVIHGQPRDPWRRKIASPEVDPLPGDDDEIVFRGAEPGIEPSEPSPAIASKS